MKDLMGMMGRLQEMQTKMEDVQAEIKQIEVEGSAGGGMVNVILSGKGDLKGLKIDPSLLTDPEMVEDLIMAAHADARAKAEAAMNEKMQEMTAGLPIPPGMKLPF